MALADISFWLSIAFGGLVGGTSSRLSILIFLVSADSGPIFYFLAEFFVVCDNEVFRYREPKFVMMIVWYDRLGLEMK